VHTHQRIDNVHRATTTPPGAREYTSLILS
jgi:hypothetical protein